MSFTTTSSEISGITVAVPKLKINNPKKKKSDIDFIKHTGVKSRFSDSNLNTSEFVIAATEITFEKTKLSKKKCI